MTGRSSTHLIGTALTKIYNRSEGVGLLRFHYLYHCDYWWDIRTNM